MSRHKISIIVPTHDMENKEFFLERLQNSLEAQTFTDFETIITNEGKMAANTNAGIKKATGEVIKILFMDDYLYSPDALQHIADSFKGGWLASGCVHDSGTYISNPHYPLYTDKMVDGVNTIGSPSVIAFENDEPLLFDENMSWLLDCDLYTRLHARYGAPTIVNYLDVGIGIGTHQTTHTMPDSAKLEEASYMFYKHHNTA